MSLVVDGFKYLELNINDSVNLTKYGLESNPKIRKYFLDYLFNYLLLPYESPKNASAAAAATIQQPTAAGNETQTSATSEIPACMNEKTFKQFKNDVNLQEIDELEQV